MDRGMHGKSISTAWPIGKVVKLVGKVVEKRGSSLTECLCVIKDFIYCSTQQNTGLEERREQSSIFLN